MEYQNITAHAVWALSWIGWRVYIRRSLFALCIAHCSQFEHSGDSTMQSSQCVTVHPVPKFRSCHKAIMVITGRAHCYTFCIFRSLLMQFEQNTEPKKVKLISRKLWDICIISRTSIVAMNIWITLSVWSEVGLFERVTNPKTFFDNIFSGLEAK